MAPAPLSLALFGVVAALALALAAKPLLMPTFIELVTQPPDDTIGEIATLTQEELVPFYENKSVLLIGGTRGTGFGTALVMAKAGAAHISVVGRSDASGQKAVDALRAAAKQHSGSPQQQIEYLKGDLGTVQSTMELVNKLEQQQRLYDYVVVSAGTFPDWDSLQNAEGLEKSFAIGVVGRFLIYRNLNKFVHPKRGRVLNILASGMSLPYNLDEELAKGYKNPTTLPEAIMNVATGNEVMMVALDERDELFKRDMSLVVRVSTHPGAVESELGRGQATWFQLISKISKMFVGLTQEECGLRQASILACDRLPHGKQSYVDAFGIGRKRSKELQSQVDAHLHWLSAWLFELEKSYVPPAGVPAKEELEAPSQEEEEERTEETPTTEEAAEEEATPQEETETISSEEPEAPPQEEETEAISEEEPETPPPPTEETEVSLTKDSEATPQETAATTATDEPETSPQETESE